MTDSDPDLGLPHNAPDEMPEPAKIGFDAIGGSLRAGWRDFMRAPGYGLFFSAFYVLGSWMLWPLLPDGSGLYAALVWFGIGLIGMEFATIFTKFVSIAPSGRYCPVV